LPWGGRAATRNIRVPAGSGRSHGKPTNLTAAPTHHALQPIPPHAPRVEAAPPICARIRYACLTRRASGQQERTGHRPNRAA
jgi:hypothetical protein